MGQAGGSGVTTEDRRGRFLEISEVLLPTVRRPGPIDNPRALGHDSAMERGRMHLTLLRGAHLFSGGTPDVEKLERQSRIVRMAPDQLFHPAEVREMPGEEPDAQTAAAEFAVRRGKLRVSRFLPDGREVTLAVLQAGAAFTVRPAGPEEASDPEADRYDLDDIVLMALGEGELWALPAGTVG